MTESDATALKRCAAERALLFVRPGMKLGLGTGSTAEAFLEVLAPRVRGGLDIVGAPSSERTAAKARGLGIPVASLEEIVPLDLTIDGADEADRNLTLIKGGGGALLREKIVAKASARMVVIADGSKLVAGVGAFPLPIEVVRFAHQVTASKIEAAAAALGYSNLQMRLRMAGDAAFTTDSGNVIYDCAFGPIANPPELAVSLKSLTGVVEHGLFIGIATALIVAHSLENVEVLEREPNGEV